MKKSIKPIYLDYAAATPVDTSVLEVMRPYFSDKFYNPSANSLKSREIKHDIEKARSLVADILGAKSGEIIFTAGGTEANNLALNGISQANEKGHIITSALEHESILMPLGKLNKNKWGISEIKPKVDGVIDVNDVMKSIRDDTVLVSIMYVNNEIGTIQPIKQIAKNLQIVRKNRLKSGNKTPLYLHTDAAQATNYLDIHVNNLGVDLMTINGGKIYGPKQTGVLFVKKGVNITPLIYGGGQENGMRSGTENVAGIIGFSTALKITSDLKNSESKRLSELFKYFIVEIKKTKIIINGSLINRIPNNIHILLPGKDNERVLYELEEKGIICAVGSACSASNEEPSHVLSAIGLSVDDIRSSLRITMGRKTTKKDITMLLNALRALY